MVISYHTSQILVAICSLDGGMVIIGRRCRCRHSILQTFICVCVVCIWSRQTYFFSRTLLFAHHTSVFWLRLGHSFVRSFVSSSFFLLHARHNLHINSIQRHTHTHSTDRASLFLGIFVHLIPLCLVPPNSQLVFFFSMSHSIVFCSTVTYEFEIDIDGGTRSAVAIVVLFLCFFR